MARFVRRLKTVSSISVLSLAGAISAQGCSGEHAESERVQEGANPSIITSQAEGASEGGEGEGGLSMNPATDDVDYLHRLGQVRGHLVAFLALHKLGAHEMSATHAKHPQSELYADLKPAFAARNKPGFADELTALAQAMRNGASEEDIDSAYLMLTAAIANNEPDVSIVVWLKAIAVIARTAGDEYKIGVADDGMIANAHEYQDAYGFLTAAREMLSRLKGANNEESEAIAKADAQLVLALGEFSDLRATKIKGRSSPIFGAAARIELLALALE